MQQQISKLQQDLNDLDDYETTIDDRLKESDVSDAEKIELQKEKRAITASRQATQKRLDDIRKNLSQLTARRQQLEAALNTKLPAKSGNLSIRSIPQRMNQDQERATQWVSAAYPHTDGFRAPILAWLRKWAPKSRAAEHFEKWSNRYTLVKAWQFRSGYRPQKSGSTRVRWNKTATPLRMFVMKDSFRGSQNRKGREPWTGTSPRGLQLAEEYFTVIGVAHRDYEPVFSSRLYPAPAGTGLTAYAQAIFYNANPQRLASGSAQTQPQLGWDTLNWDPGIRVPQWAAPALRSAPKWPWDAFDGSTSQTVAKVRLNWQARLMPVRTRRLEQAAVTVSGDTRKNL